MKICAYDVHFFVEWYPMATGDTLQTHIMRGTVAHQDDPIMRGVVVRHDDRLA